MRTWWWGLPVLYRPHPDKGGGVYEPNNEPHPVVGPESCDGGPLGSWIRIMMQRDALLKMAYLWNEIAIWNFSSECSVTRWSECT